MAEKQRVYEANSLHDKPLQIRRKTGREHSPVEQYPLPADKLRLPESRDVVLRLIEKLKQH